MAPREETEHSGCRQNNGTGQSECQVLLVITVLPPQKNHPILVEAKAQQRLYKLLKDTPGRGAGVERVGIAICKSVSQFILFATTFEVLEGSPHYGVGVCPPGVSRKTQLGSEKRLYLRAEKA